MASYAPLAGGPTGPVAMDENDDIIIEPDMLTGEPSGAKKGALGGAGGVGASTFVQSGSETVHQDQVSPASLQTAGGRQSGKIYTGGPFSLNHYRQYFDLDTQTFFGNCIASINPLASVPADALDMPGDLYGSVWITATLVFLLFFCNTLAELLSGALRDVGQPRVNYFGMIVSSLNLLYGYTVLVPLGVYLALRFYFRTERQVPLTRLMALYSYANLLWIPAAFLSIFRGLLVNHQTLGGALKWICVLIGGALSGASVLFKVKQYLDMVLGESREGLALLALLVVAHVGYTVGIKVCFYGNL